MNIQLPYIKQGTKEDTDAFKAAIKLILPQVKSKITNDVMGHRFMVFYSTKDAAYDKALTDANNGAIILKSKLIKEAADKQAEEDRLELEKQQEHEREEQETEEQEKDKDMCFILSSDPDFEQLVDKVEYCLVDVGDEIDLSALTGLVYGNKEITEKSKKEALEALNEQAKNVVKAFYSVAATQDKNRKKIEQMLDAALKKRNDYFNNKKVK